MPRANSMLGDLFCVVAKSDSLCASQFMIWFCDHDDDYAHSSVALLVILLLIPGLAEQGFEDEHRRRD